MNCLFNITNYTIECILTKKITLAHFSNNSFILHLKHFLRNKNKISIGIMLIFLRK